MPRVATAVRVTLNNECVAHDGETRALAIGPLSGQVLASGGSDGCANVWCLRKAPLVLGVRDLRRAATAVAFSPSERLLAVGTEGGLVRAVALGAAGAAARCSFAAAHRAAVTCLEWLGARDAEPDRVLASGGADGRVVLLDIERGAIIATLTHAASAAFSGGGGGGGAPGAAAASAGDVSEITCLRFAPHGKWLAAGDAAGRVIVYDLGSGRPIFCFERDGGGGGDGGSGGGGVEGGHRGAVMSLDFHPDELILGSGGSDGTVRFWGLDAAAGRLGLLATSPVDAGAVRAVRFIHASTGAGAAEEAAAAPPPCTALAAVTDRHLRVWSVPGVWRANVWGETHTLDIVAVGSGGVGGRGGGWGGNLLVAWIGSNLRDSSAAVQAPAQPPAQPRLQLVVLSADGAFMRAHGVDLAGVAPLNGRSEPLLPAQALAPAPSPAPLLSRAQTSATSLAAAPAVADGARPCRASPRVARISLEGLHGRPSADAGDGESSSGESGRSGEEVGRAGERREARTASTVAARTSAGETKVDAGSIDAASQTAAVQAARAAAAAQAARAAAVAQALLHVEAVSAQVAGLAKDRGHILQAQAQAQQQHAVAAAAVHARSGAAVDSDADAVAGAAGADASLAGSSEFLACVRGTVTVPPLAAAPAPAPLREPAASADFAASELDVSIGIGVDEIADAMRLLASPAVGERGGAGRLPHVALGAEARPQPGLAAALALDETALFPRGPAAPPEPPQRAAGDFVRLARTLERPVGLRFASFLPDAAAQGFSASRATMPGTDVDGSAARERRPADAARGLGLSCADDRALAQAGLGRGAFMQRLRGRVRAVGRARRLWRASDAAGALASLCEQASAVPVADAAVGAEAAADVLAALTGLVVQQAPRADGAGASPFRAAAAVRVAAGAERYERLGLSLGDGILVLDAALRLAGADAGVGAGAPAAGAGAGAPAALVALLAAQAVFGAHAAFLRTTRATFLGAGSGGGLGGGAAISLRAVEALGLEPGAEDRLRRCAAAAERLERLRALAEPLAARRPPPGASAEQAAGVAALVAAARAFAAHFDAWRASL